MIHGDAGTLTADVAVDARSWLDRWWVAACGLMFIVGSDYRYRIRDPRAAVSATLDAAILIELGLYGVVAWLLLTRIETWPRLRRIPLHLYLASFLVGLWVLSVAYAPSPVYSLTRAIQACIVLAFTLVVAAKATRGDLHRFAHAFMLLVAVSVVYGVVRPSPPINRLQVGRFTWLAIHPTVSGVIAALGALLAVAYLLWGGRPRPGPRWHPLAYAGLLVVAGGATLAAQTRGAVLGLTAGIVTFVIVVVSGRTRLTVVVGLLAAAIVVALTATDTITTYFARGASEEELATLNSRTELWDAALGAFAEEPLFGYGVGASRVIFYEETGLGGGHNAVVNIAVELGLFGLICWLALVASTYLSGLRLGGSPTSGIAADRAIIVSVLVFLMVDGIFFEGVGAVTNVASTWLFMIVAWLAVARRSIADAQ